MSLLQIDTTQPEHSDVPISQISLTSYILLIGVGARGARGAIAPPLFQEQGKIYC